MDDGTKTLLSDLSLLALKLNDEGRKAEAVICQSAVIKIDYLAKRCDKLLTYKMAQNEREQLEAIYNSLLGGLIK